MDREKLEERESAVKTVGIPSAILQGMQETLPMFHAALEAAATLVGTALWLGTEEGRKTVAMQGMMAVASLHHQAVELVEKNPYWARRFGMVDAPEGSPIPAGTVPGELSKVAEKTNEFGHQVRAMHAIRKALVENIIRAAAQAGEPSFGTFATVLAKLEGIKE